MVFVVLLSEEMDMATRVLILDEAVGISLSANALWKGIHPIILPSVNIREDRTL